MMCTIFSFFLKEIDYNDIGQIGRNYFLIYKNMRSFVEAVSIRDGKLLCTLTYFKDGHAC